VATSVCSHCQAVRFERVQDDLALSTASSAGFERAVRDASERCADIRVEASTADSIVGPTGNPLAWAQSFSATLSVGNQVTWPNWQLAPDGPFTFSFYLIPLPHDDEGGNNFASWVNLQPVVYAAGEETLWGNMQPEFR